jgi:hypothetical protein
MPVGRTGAASRDGPDTTLPETIRAERRILFDGLNLVLRAYPGRRPSFRLRGLALTSVTGIAKI